nr:MAG TPA: hypothetical protein [Caudoviricetes sp.]
MTNIHLVNGYKNSHLIPKWLFCVSHVAFLVVYLQHYQCP